MTRPTDEQIAALVKAALNVFDRDDGTIPSPRVLHELRVALAPFRPDPDAEAVEAMARAYMRKGFGTSLDDRPELARSNTLDGMRAALAALREWEANHAS